MANPGLEPKFDVQFPVPAGVTTQLNVPPSPQGQADPFMRQLATTQQTRESLVCKTLLQPGTLARAEAIADELYPKMLTNTVMMMQYGQSSVEGMNSLIDRLLKEVEPVDIPELTSLMHELSVSMRKIRGKYDVSDPKIRAKLEEWSRGPRRAYIFFGELITLIQALMEDAQSIESQLERVKAQLADKTEELMRNVARYDQLYVTNEQEIINVVGAIAIMELIVDRAREEMESIEVDPDDPTHRDLVERKRYLGEFATNMEIRITEYKNRLFVGWTTSPNVTNMRTLDVGMAQKLDLLINLTIPTMKATIVQWRMMIQAMQAARMDKEVSGEANKWLRAYSAASAEAVPMIAQQVQTPSLTPETIAAMAQSIQQQADGLIAAYQKGYELRAEVDDAIVKAQRVIQQANVRISEEVVNGLVAQATKPVYTDITPSGSAT